MAGFFKKLLDQVKKEYPDVGELIDSVREGKMKQYFQDQVAEITGFGTPSGQKTYSEYLEEERQSVQHVRTNALRDSRLSIATRLILKWRPRLVD